MLFEVVAHFPPDAPPQRLRPIEADSLAKAQAIARNLHGLWPVGTIMVGGQILAWEEMSPPEEMPPASQQAPQRRAGGFAVSAEGQHKAQATLARQRADKAAYEAKASHAGKRQMRAARKKPHEARVRAYWAAKYPHLKPLETTTPPE